MICNYETAITDNHKDRSARLQNLPFLEVLLRYLARLPSTKSKIMIEDKKQQLKKS